MNLPFNWVDWVIIALIGYYAFQGWESGLVHLGSSLISFLISLFVAIRFHQPVGTFLTEKFGIPEKWTVVIGYIIVAFVAEAVVSQLVQVLASKLPKKIVDSKINNWLGSILSAINGLLVVSFFLIILMVLPLRGTIKTDVRASTIGGRIVQTAETYGGPIKTFTDEVRQEALKFFTISPNSKERKTLDVSPEPKDLKEDKAQEQKMVDLVNAERKKNGISALAVDTKIAAVARSHSRDMFMRRYFAHVNPEGLTPADRMQRGGVPFGAAGENLAYAPDLETAHQGLMDSPEHKKNILDPTFRRIGIGIITTDSFGTMYTQNFSD